MTRMLRGLAFVTVGILLASGAAFAQDASGVPDEVAAELAAVAAWEAAPVFAPAAPAAPLRKPEATVFFSNFDTDNGGLVGTRDWEWGTSYAFVGSNCSGTSHVPPPAPYSGVGMWATVLNNCHNNLGNNQGYADCVNTAPDDDSILTLTVDLTDYTAATLSWYEWYDLFSGWDWGELRINGAQAFVDCRGSYVAPTAWVQRTVDLGPYVGGVATIAWHMMASSVVNYSGWYIDDVLVDGTPIPVELQSFSAE